MTAHNTAYDRSGRREWVVGFLLNTEADRVVLVRKNRPEWQAGKLNGVGGGVEADDRTFASAMRREFHEETGVIISDWQHFASLTWEQGVVHFFRAFWPDEVLAECHTTGLLAA